MKQWHCSIGGRQYGPVSEEEIRSWAVTGRIKPTDYVWSEGMTDWVPASTVEGLLPAGAATAAAAAMGPVVSYLKPHRGGAVLALGIIGIVACFICGIIAWVMGSNDLRQMRAGVMDRSGESVTQAGRICGIIGTILGLLSFLWIALWMIVVFGFGVAGGLR